MRVAKKLKALTFLVGAFGSGKTEVSLNLALAATGEGLSVTLIDLDTVTPALRSRQAASILADAGVELIAPVGQLAYADLPAVPSGVRSAIEDEARSVIVDVGGSPAGARVLASMAEPIATRGHECWAVVSPWRPDTSSPATAVRELRAIEELGRLPLTGIVCNLHLPAELTAEEIKRGWDVVAQTARDLGIPVVFCTAGPGRADQAQTALAGTAGAQQVDIMELKLFMKAPWEDDPAAAPWTVATAPAARAAARRYE